VWVDCASSLSRELAFFFQPRTKKQMVLFFSFLFLHSLSLSLSLSLSTPLHSNSARWRQLNNKDRKAILGEKPTSLLWNVVVFLFS
jgi:hypothetical protein